jgi:hypothetical protein
MRWQGVPMGLRARVWRGVQLLHDLQQHAARFHKLHPTLCFHAHAPLLLCEARNDRVFGDRRLPNCPRCAARWRCEDCGVDFVLHDHS